MTHAPDDVPAPETPRYHALAVGAGPANLSLAALFPVAAPHRIALFDRSSGPSWHPGLLHDGVKMQTSWMKDLVSLVDPCHRLSFMNYLVTTGRVYALLNAQYAVIPRREYELYLAWAAERIDDVHYGVAIDRVSFDDDGFTAYSGGSPVGRSEHLVLGLGSDAYRPPGFDDLPAESVFVADDLEARIGGMTDPAAPVAVVGGGQTGAEAVVFLLGRGFTDISWFGRRPWFAPIDDSPPANDFYRPAYLEFLQGLGRDTRRRLVGGQTLTGDAITPGLLQAIYQTNYEGMLRLGRFPLTFYPDRDVLSADPADDGLTLPVRTVEGTETHHARHVVLATGRRPAPLPLDDDLRERIDVDDGGDLIVEADFSVRWKGMNGHRIYVQNRARYSHGVLDANLTLLPVRSAMILNSMFDRPLLPIRDGHVSTVWG